MACVLSILIILGACLVYGAMATARKPPADRRYTTDEDHE